MGREPELSIAEIKAVAEVRGVSLTWLKFSEQYVVVESQDKLDFFEDLAGTIKVAEVVNKTKFDKNELHQRLLEYVKQTADGKAIFGISWYGSKVPNFAKQFGIALKHDIKEDISRVRYVVSKDVVLSSVTVKMNKLLPPTGFEFVLMVDKEAVVIGRTIWVQNFADWSERDFGRPARDAKVGMLPPKLARLMINLARADKSKPILDPFCGSGTVLQEAALLGFQNIWGSDIDAKGIERTKANFEWLKNSQPNLQWQQHVKVADVRHLAGFVGDTKFGGMVTEPYLGPPLRGHEDLKFLQQVQNGLTEFYRQAFKAMSGALLPQAVLVMVVPVLNFNKKPLYLELPNMAAMGLQLVKVLPENYQVESELNRTPLVYARPDQRVAREIWVWQKK